VDSVLLNLVDKIKNHENYTSPDIFPIKSKPDFRTGDEFMSKIKLILEAKLDDDEYGISQLCCELSVSHTQLYRLFKSVSHRTIAEYFKSLRLNQAKILLSSTTMNVTEVAFAAGFKNLSYFSREFTHHYGKSPKEFRS